MTDIQKQKAQHWTLEFIKSGVTPILVIMTFWQIGVWRGEYEAHIKERTLDPVEKAGILYHIENSRTELDNYKSQMRSDSVFDILAIELDEKKEIKSLAEKNAVQIYKMNDQQKKFQVEIMDKLNKIITNQ